MKTFCDETNLVPCLSNLDRELEISDYPIIFGGNQRETKVILVNAVNVLYSVLADLRKRTTSNNDLTLENARLRNQVEALSVSIANKNKSLDKVLSRSEDLKKSLSELTLAKESVEKEVKQIKLENQQFMKNLSHQASQHEHEIRRRDNEITQLKNKIRPCSVKRPLGDSSDQGRSQGESQASMKLKENYIQSLVDNIQHMVSENCALRACLLDLHARASASLKKVEDERCRNLLHLSADEVIWEHLNLSVTETMSGGIRYFLNQADDFTPQKNFSIDFNAVKKTILDNIYTCLEKQQCTQQGIDGGLYVGTCGNAYTFYHLSRKARFAAERNVFLQKACETMRTGIDIARRTKSRDPSDECAFLLGKAGVYALAAAVFHEAGEEIMAQDCIRDFIQVGAHCAPLTYARFGGDELLVGRAGYLCGAQWLNRQFGTQVIPEDIMHAMCDSILESGQRFSQSRNYHCPLVYAYYKTEYLGAAHGLSSILQMLLKCDSYLTQHPRAEVEIKKAVDYLLSLQTPNGNFPCALDEVGAETTSRDELVHWCHGGPGVIYLMVLAYYRWHESKYLTAAVKIGDLVWEKGLLKKGPGICHGIAGNGYVFLILYKIKKDVKYLYRANEFAKFLNSKEFTKARIPDNPYSLYEGFAGTICFLADLMDPETASFPFFEVN